jgi:hypothetical protein
MVCFLFIDLPYNMLLPRLIIIFLFIGVLLKSTITLSTPFQFDIDNIGFVDDETDDLNDQNIYFFSISLPPKHIPRLSFEYSEKTIDRAYFIETPPPELG